MHTTSAAIGQDVGSSRPLLITGCGRSGTVYISKALTAAGLSCSHERIFTGRDSDDRVLQRGMAEASWFAVPWLPALTSDALVAHQVRHPLKCISSYVGMGFFDLHSYERPIWKHYAKRALGAGPSGQLRIVQMVKRFRPEVFEHRTPAERGAVFWVRWNLWVEQQCRDLGLDYRRIRLEDVNASVLKTLINDVGVTPRTNMAQRAAEIPTRINTRQRRSRLSWADLGAHADDVRCVAERYGYDEIS